jgi:GAF domain-containing protein
MPAPSLPLNESERYSALMGHNLRQNQLWDAEANELVRKAVHDFGVSQAAIALVGKDTVYFAAAAGTDFHKLPRELSFCGYAIHSRNPLVVPNAAQDIRFADNPLVAGPPFVRFYAGAPLVDADGYCLGTFCIVDMNPRSMLEQEVSQLVSLSVQAMRRIDFLSVISELRLLSGDALLV